MSFAGASGTANVTTEGPLASVLLRPIRHRAADGIVLPKSGVGYLPLVFHFRRPSTVIINQTVERVVLFRLFKASTVNLF